MTSPRSQAELVTLRKLAQEIASSRRERITSVHLIAAIAAGESAAGGLLRERRLDEEALLKASRSFDDDGPDPIGRLLTAAREAGKRGTGAEPSALHLLLALLADRSAAAHRALVHAGVDLARLRAAAMQLALGVVAARRSTFSASRREPVAPPASAARRLPRAERDEVEAPPVSLSPSRSSGPGVAVPFIPPSRRTAAPSPAAAKEKATAVPMPRRGEARALPVGPRHAASGGPVSPATVARVTLDRALFPTLASLGKNLGLASLQGELDPIVGRESEIEQVLDVLAKRHGNCPCLVGPAGVGKTSVARGLARRLAAGAGDGEPRILVELVLSELVAGAAARSALGERLAAIRAEVRDAKGRVVLFVDEVHELFAGGVLDDAMAELKLALARGELALVAATTPEEYRRSIESDPALARRFSVVEIEEPCEEDAFLILQSAATGLGAHHALRYADEALASAVSWSVRYLPGRALPDKALSILDLAGARARRKAGALVGPGEVAEVVAELADLPVERLLETDRERMLSLEKLFAERVVGHDAALTRVARVLRRNAAGLRGRRPIGSFLCLGPTGVGKTETAKAIAEALFHSADAMTRLDLSEYAEAHAVARLVGAPPGYVGYEAGGQLTEAVRRRPYQVILLDEIEKAHRDVLEAFLQVFDEGRLTDGRGRRVDLTNTVIVMTSNLGAAEVGAMKSAQRVGFSSASRPGSDATAAASRMAETMIAAARAHLPPELYNRIDEVLCFGALGREEVAEIARRLLDGLADTLLARGVQLDIDPAVVDALLAAGGFDPELGARPLKRVIGRLIENPLAELLLRGDLPEGAVGVIGVEKGEILVDAVGGRRKVRAG